MSKQEEASMTPQEFELRVRAICPFGQSSRRNPSEATISAIKNESSTLVIASAMSECYSRCMLHYVLREHLAEIRHQQAIDQAAKESA